MNLTANWSQPVHYQGIEVRVAYRTNYGYQATATVVLPALLQVVAARASRVAEFARDGQGLRHACSRMLTQTRPMCSLARARRAPRASGTALSGGASRVAGACVCGCAWKRRMTTRGICSSRDESWLSRKKCITCQSVVVVTV